MKKNIFKTLCILLLACLFPSCSQDSFTEESIISENSTLKINNVLNENNKNDQKIKYNLLAKESKHTLWANKLEVLLNDQSIILNEEQKKLIEELKKKIDITLFDNEDNDEKAYFKDIYIPNFLKRAQKVFSNKQIISFFYTLSEPITSSSLTLKQLSTSLSVDSEKDCDCNYGSIYSCQGTYAYTCDKTAKCLADTSGCGFLTMFECNGLCGS